MEHPGAGARELWAALPPYTGKPEPEPAEPDRTEAEGGESKPAGSEPAELEGESRFEVPDPGRVRSMCFHQLLQTLQASGSHSKSTQSRSWAASTPTKGPWG